MFPTIGEYVVEGPLESLVLLDLPRHRWSHVERIAFVILMELSECLVLDSSKTKSMNDLQKELRKVTCCKTY